VYGVYMLRFPVALYNNSIRIYQITGGVLEILKTTLRLLISENCKAINKIINKY